MSANDPSSPRPTPDLVPTQPDPVVQPGYAAFPAPGAPIGQPAPPVGVPGETVTAPAVVPAPERVGRGLLFSLGGIVVGVVLTVIVWRMNFVASIAKFQVVLENLLAPEVWAGYGSGVAMYVLFAALGTFGLIRQLGRARGA